MIQALALAGEPGRTREKSWHVIAKARRDRPVVVVAISLIASRPRIALGKRRDVRLSGRPGGMAVILPYRLGGGPIGRLLIG